MSDQNLNLEVSEDTQKNTEGPVTEQVTEPITEKVTEQTAEPITEEIETKLDENPTQDILESDEVIPEESNVSKMENKPQTETSTEIRERNHHLLVSVLASMAAGIVASLGTLAVAGTFNPNVTTGTNKADSAVVSSTPTSTTPVSTYTATSMTDIIDSSMPSIVAITCTSQTQVQSFWGMNTEDVESAGSGVIISQDDNYLYIVTNYHVVSGATSVLINLNDNTTVNADIKGYDEDNDLAVLAIKKSSLTEDTINNISVATVNSDGNEKVGDQVIAIGNALGYGQSVTSGIISALNKTVSADDGSTNTLTQTDAAINPGNSGGALINMSGELIGINCAKYSSTDVEGMGFTIPMATALPIINSIIEEEYTPASETPYVGIEIVTIDSETSSYYGYPEGVLVQNIYDKSPAIGVLQVGDVITSINKTKVATSEDLQNAIAECTPGDKISVTLQRYVSKGKYEEKTVELEISSKMTLQTQKSEKDSDTKSGTNEQNGNYNYQNPDSNSSNNSGQDFFNYFFK